MSNKKSDKKSEPVVEVDADHIDDAVIKVEIEEPISVEPEAPIAVAAEPPSVTHLKRMLASRDVQDIRWDERDGTWTVSGSHDTNAETIRSEIEGALAMLFPVSITSHVENGRVVIKVRES